MSQKHNICSLIYWGKQSQTIHFCLAKVIKRTWVLKVILLIPGSSIKLLHFNTWAPSSRVSPVGISSEELLSCLRNSICTFLQIIPVVFKELSEGLLSYISYNSSPDKPLLERQTPTISFGKLMIPLEVLCFVSHSAVFR